MKLSEYAIELVNAIRNENNGGDVTIKLFNKHMGYRDVIGLAIYDAFCGASVSDTLEIMSARYNESKAALAGAERLLTETAKEVAELKAKLGAMAASKPVKPKPKAKLTLKPAKDSAVKGAGKSKAATEQEKLDAAMQGVRKRHAEKKAAQKEKIGAVLEGMARAVKKDE